MGHKAREARMAGIHTAMYMGQWLLVLLVWLGGPAGGLVPEGQLWDPDGDMGP